MTVAQSSITDARRRREALAGLSSQTWDETEAELTAAEGQANAAATDALATIENDFNQATEAVLVEGAELRSGYEALAQEAGGGRLSADEVAARLEDLARRRAALDNDLLKLSHAIEVADRIESDPLAYIEDIWRRFPQTAPTFSF